jgi:hypothetical protein
LTSHGARVCHAHQQCLAQGSSHRHSKYHADAGSPLNFGGERAGRRCWGPSASPRAQPLPGSHFARPGCHASPAASFCRLAARHPVEYLAKTDAQWLPLDAADGGPLTPRLRHLGRDRRTRRAARRIAPWRFGRVAMPAARRLTSPSLRAAHRLLARLPSQAVAARSVSRLGRARSSPFRFTRYWADGDTTPSSSGKRCGRRPRDCGECSYCPLPASGRVLVFA